MESQESFTQNLASKLDHFIASVKSFTGKDWTGAGVTLAWTLGIIVLMVFTFRAFDNIFGTGSALVLILLLVVWQAVSSQIKKRDKEAKLVNGVDPGDALANFIDALRAGAYPTQAKDGVLRIKYACCPGHFIAVKTYDMQAPTARQDLMRADISYGVNPELNSFSGVSLDDDDEEEPGAEVKKLH